MFEVGAHVHDSEHSTEKKGEEYKDGCGQYLLAQLINLDGIRV